jgi:hypothetical protein
LSSTVTQDSQLYLQISDDLTAEWQKFDPNLSLAEIGLLCQPGFSARFGD